MTQQTPSAAIEAVETVASGQDGVCRETVCLEHIVKNHIEDVTCFAYRLLGWEGQAEDIVQDVFLTAAEKIKTLQRPASIKAWLFTITVNKCRTYRYRQKLRSGFLALSSRTEITSTPAGDVVAEQEKYAAVRQAVKKLPGPYREAVVLKYLEQLPTAEVMQILGINENTLNSRLMRARNLLREKLELFRETV